jgi:hypothetical protein
MHLPVPDLAKSHILSREAQVETAGTARPARALAIAIAGLLGFWWGYPIMVRMVVDADFPFHIATAETFAATGAITVPHFLLQVLLGGVLFVAGGGATTAIALAFFSVLYGAAAMMICWFIARDGVGARALVASVALAFAVIVAAPVLPREELPVFLIGYFPPNVYHNPTMLLAKPFLVLALAVAMAAITRTGAPTARELAGLSLPVMFLGAAKPNYLGCLMPALVVVGLWRVRAGQREFAARRIAALCGAAFLILAATYVRYRAERRFETGIMFAPLTVIAHYVPVDAASIVTSVLASVAFPLSVTLLWPRLAWRDRAMSLAWAGAIIGLLFSYLAAETGPRQFDGNFLWTGQMGVFVLFVAAAAFVRRRFSAGAPLDLLRLAPAAIVLLLHVEAGFRHVTVKVPPAAWWALWP